MKRKPGKSIRSVAVVTGSRADYGLLCSTMTAIAGDRDLRLQVVVAGMHLLRKFGHTIDDIIRDGWTVDARIPMQRGDDEPVDQARGLSHGVGKMADFFEKSGTQIVVVLGDRIEAMAGALAAVTTGRILAHIHGGDVAPGDFDDNLRNAVTKLAHIHFTATESARDRVIQMGEPPERVHFVGAPGLDDLRQMLNQNGHAKQRSGTALILHHPRGRSAGDERRTMTDLLAAVEETALKRFIIYPNTDRGNAGILSAIETHRTASESGFVEVFPSLKRDEFLHALIHADVLVGNSSSGIIEAATAGTPVVNVGPRQMGRERSGLSVVDSEESRGSILRALRMALKGGSNMGGCTVYGEGRSGEKIARHLAKIPINPAFRRKRNVL